jgi:hypothetical protein
VWFASVRAHVLRPRRAERARASAPVTIERLEAAIALVERLIAEDGDVHQHLLNRLKQKLREKRARQTSQ